jgi:ATP-dependent DNA helicase RecQ
VSYDATRALELLRAGAGVPTVAFRDGQEAAIEHIVEGRGRLLVVQKTGWGKSFVYFIATKLLREQRLGPTLLVSPLLALMRNQIAAAERMGVRAATINSDNQAEWTDVEDALHRDEVDILLVSPERFANERFQSDVLARIADRIALVVIDEAHCISDWGHDFRPHYRLIERIVGRLPSNVRLLATTATANNRVLTDLRSVLGPGLDVSRGDLQRPSLELQTIRLTSQADRLAWLAQYVPQIPGTGIIYTLTVRDADQVASWLRSRGLEVAAYHSASADQRAPLEQALLENRLKALVATTALGMGFDKPDLAFVIHYQTPGSVIAYYQQVGRAGRALESALGVLLSGLEETEINEYFIETAFPTRDQVHAVISALEGESRGLSMRELEAKVNLSRGRILKTIDLLSLESPAPIARQGGKWQLTAATLSGTFWQRAERLTQLRRDEHLQMQQYVRLTSGHMEFLIRALDGEPGPVRTGEGKPLPATPDPRIVQAATDFLRHSSCDIDPRIQWPARMPALGVSGAIVEGYRAMPGKALCRWGDAGWGSMVRTGKYRDGKFPDELLAACQELFGRWAPQPAPEWVTCIPSRRHPDLVPDFARRLARTLGLPFVSALATTDDRPEQKAMSNSVQQARNLDGAIGVVPHAVRNGPVLLVDDMVDSRWTLTVAAWLLRSNGSGPVWPFVLAQAGARQ